MYFSARLSVDPSQLTKIERVEPEGVFGKVFHFLTAGATSQKVEKETFAAVSILQQLHRLFWDMEINNIIRLSHDDIDIYLDEEGRKDDLKEALDRYELTINDAMSHHFNTLNLVLEHEDSDFIHLIEIDINRTHGVGVYPITIKINGLIKEFRANPLEHENSLKSRMKEYFESQQRLDAFVAEKRVRFETFVNELSLRMQRYIKVDDVKTEINGRMPLRNTRKGKRTRNTSQRERRYTNDPVFDGYFGFAEIMLYGYLWSELLHDHSLHVGDMDLVGEDAAILGHIGDEGLDAGEADLFNTDLDLDTRLDGFGEEVAEVMPDMADMDMGSDSWFDSSDFGTDSFDVGDFGDVDF